MSKSKFSESQIVAILKEGEAGLPVAEVCRKHGISAPTYYAWKSIRRRDGLGPDAHARAGRGERPAQAHVCGPGAGERGDQGRAGKKILTPSATSLRLCRLA